MEIRSIFNILQVWKRFLSSFEARPLQASSPSVYLSDLTLTCYFRILLALLRAGEMDAAQVGLIGSVRGPSLL